MSKSTPLHIVDARCTEDEIVAVRSILAEVVILEPAKASFPAAVPKSSAVEAAAVRKRMTASKSPGAATAQIVTNVIHTINWQVHLDVQM